MSPIQKRLHMITREIDVILGDAQGYLLKRMIAEDLGEDAKDALRKAASELAYRKQYYDTMEDSLVYFPSCKKLIMSHELMEEAEKFFHDREDEFPPEYSKALKTVVAVSESRKLMDRSLNSDYDYNDDYEYSNYDDDCPNYDLPWIGNDVDLSSIMVEKLGRSWRETSHEVVQYRMSLT